MRIGKHLGGSNHALTAATVPHKDRAGKVEVPGEPVAVPLNRPSGSLSQAGEVVRNQESARGRTEIVAVVLGIDPIGTDTHHDATLTGEPIRKVAVAGVTWNGDRVAIRAPRRDRVGRLAADLRARLVFPVQEKDHGEASIGHIPAGVDRHGDLREILHRQGQVDLDPLPAAEHGASLGRKRALAAGVGQGATRSIRGRWNRGRGCHDGGQAYKGESDQNRNSNARRQAHTETISARVTCQRRYVVPLDLCCQIAATPCFGERQAGQAPPLLKPTPGFEPGAASLQGELPPAVSDQQRVPDQRPSTSRPLWRTTRLGTPSSGRLRSRSPSWNCRPHNIDRT